MRALKAESGMTFGEVLSVMEMMGMGKKRERLLRRAIDRNGH